MKSFLILFPSTISRNQHDWHPTFSDFFINFPEPEFLMGVVCQTWGNGTSIIKLGLDGYDEHSFGIETANQLVSHKC